MKADQLTNRSTVYRAVYYSGFDWKKNKNEKVDTYTLTMKDQDFNIVLTHKPLGEFQDQLIVERSTKLELAHENRLQRLLAKISRRSVKLDIVDNKEGQ